MRHCGMDVHLRSTTAEVLDLETGEVTRRVLRTERESLRSWLSREPPMRVVLESGASSHWVAEAVEQLGHEVIVVDPRRTSAVAVAGGCKKTDALDASTLAWLSSKDALVPSYRSSPAMREWRRLLTTRQRMVHSRGDLVADRALGARRTRNRPSHSALHDLRGARAGIARGVAARTSSPPRRGVRRANRYRQSRGPRPR